MAIMAAAPNNNGTYSGWTIPGPTGPVNNLSGAAGADLSGAVWGSTIPISMGYRAITGVVLWGGPESKINQRTTVLPGVPVTTSASSPPQVNTAWDVTRPFAVSLGLRLNPDGSPPEIRRIWVDGKLAYANGSSQPVEWDNINERYLPTGQFINGVWVSPDGSGPGDIGGITFTNGATLGTPTAPPLQSAKSTLKFRFHPGGNTVPDDAIVADLGDLAPTYKRLMYLVIEGLIFGTGAKSTYDVSQYGGSSINLIDDQNVNNNYPTVTVELVDTGLSKVSAFDFTMLDDATPLQFDGFPLANFDTRQIALVGMHSVGAEYWLLDMDTTTQLSATTVNDVGNNEIGGSFATWDTINNVVYASSDGGNSIVSIGPDGAELDVFPVSPDNLAPKNVDGSSSTTDAKPALNFPIPTMADVDYVLQSGSLQPVLLVSGQFAAFVGAFAPSTGGVIPASLYPRSYYDNGSNNALASIAGLRLFDDAVTLEHLSYQDACFVVAWSGGVELVYVTLDHVGADIVAHIQDHVTIHTPTYTSSHLVALVDADGNVVVQESKTGNDFLVSKIVIDRSGAPDFSVAPGWRGAFPRFGRYAYHDVAHTTWQTWNGNSVANSDFSVGTYSDSGYVLNLADGSLTAISGFSGQDSNSDIWDGPNSLVYYHGTITASPFQAFSGHGMRYVQVYGGIDGTVETIGDVVRDISEFVGYTSSEVSVDSALTDEVPGVLILKPYDLSTLFNSAGALYNFTFVDAGGQLKFASSSNDPEKAIGGWTITGTIDASPPFHSITIQDGDTCTVGTSVYTFRTTPAAPFDVKISDDTTLNGVLQANDAKEKTAANFLGALNADLTLCAADSQDPLSAPGFFAGTVKNAQVVASSTLDSTDVNGFTTITFTAAFGGPDGNSIATTTTGSHASCPHTTLIGGANPPVPTVNLTIADMSPVDENQLTQNDSIVTTIQPQGMGQQAATVDYFALEQNYIPLAQTYIPDDMDGTLLVNGSTTVTYDLPFVLSTSEAYARVAKTAFAQAQNVVVQNFRLGPAFLLLEPSDIIGVTIAPFVYQLRLDEATFNGDWSTSYGAVNYSVRTDLSIAASDATGTVPQVVPTGSDGLPLAIDAPLLDPAFGPTPGTFDLFDGIRPLTTRFSSGILSFAVVTGGSVGAPSQLYTLSRGAKWGTIVGTVPAAVEPLFRTVEDSITIASKTILGTDLASAASYTDFVAGVNCLAVGHPGNWEYVFFRDVEVVNSSVLRVVGLVRGQRGTDVAALAGHTSADYVVLVASAATGFQNGLLPQSMAASNAGTDLRYYAVGFPASRPPASVDVGVAGLTLYPFAPCQLTATLAGGNDIDLAWVRRDRFNTEFVTNPAIMSEATEAYDLEIMSGDTVLRTVNGLTSPAYTYASADQTTDGLTPGAVDTLEFRVYQKGELGRGFPRKDTVNVD